MSCGYCKYDVAINQGLEYDFATWGEPFMLAMLGGPATEVRFAEENGFPGEPEHRWAWTEDERLFRKALACLFQHGLARTSDPGSEESRLWGRTTDIVREERVWGGIHAIADELLLRDGIGGTRAEQVYRSRP